MRCDRVHFADWFHARKQSALRNAKLEFPTFSVYGFVSSGLVLFSPNAKVSFFFYFLLLVFLGVFGTCVEGGGQGV